MEEKIEQIIKWLLRLIRKEPTESTICSIMQFVKFGIVGASNTVIGYMLNVFTLWGLKTFDVSWDFVAGNIISFTLSVLWSFYWNNRYVFKRAENEARSAWKVLLKMYIAYGFTGIILCNILSWVWISVAGISKYVAPLINLIISVPLNFMLNKWWAFK